MIPHLAGNDISRFQLALSPKRPFTEVYEWPEGPAQRLFVSSAAKVYNP